MTIKAEHIKVTGTKFDARAKLTPEQRKAIIILSREGYSQRKLAEMFNVSKSAVHYIISPVSERQPSKRRTAEYWRAAKKKYRDKKLSLYKAGKIKFSKKDCL